MIVKFRVMSAETPHLILKGGKTYFIRSLFIAEKCESLIVWYNLIGFAYLILTLIRTVSPM
jgi:hypothetical protein